MMFFLKHEPASSGFTWPWKHKSRLSDQLLPDIPEIELSDYQRLPSSGSESPSVLLYGEGFKGEPIPDLDIFFERLYEYFCAKGLRCIIVRWAIEILTVVFMICFIGFLFLYVDWNTLLQLKCGVDALESGEKPCDLAEVINHRPLAQLTINKIICTGLMVILTIYGFVNFLKFFVQLKSTMEVRDFYYHSLNVTDSEIQTIPWSTIIERVVQLQKSQRLCVVRDLSEHDIIMRIMRKSNYLIGMVNKGVLSFPIPGWVPGAGPLVRSPENRTKRRLVLPKTLEWTLNWCIFHSMFDSKFCVQKDFITSPLVLKRRLIFVGVVMFLLTPCLLSFQLVFYLLRYTEEFYNHPSTASSRRWSNLSRWILREFNEVEHFFKHRMNNSTAHAINYLKQFPTPLISIIAKFILFVSSGLAGVLILLGLANQTILEGHVFGRNLLWYGVILGTLVAISRKVVTDDVQVIDPKGAMSLVVQQTHYMPKRWREKENQESVRREFETLFQYTLILMLEEVVSFFITPWLLMFVVPQRVDDILRFISEFTVYVDGVGDVCSLSLFDFEKHGNENYGSPFNASKTMRSSQGKMEKSFLSFQSSYPSWEPNEPGKLLAAAIQNFKEGQYMNYRINGQPVSTDPPAFSVGHPMLFDADQFNQPYILDWYYTSRRKAPAGERLPYSPPAPAWPGLVLARQPPDLWKPQEKRLQEINDEQLWRPYVSLRAASHMEASTSSAFIHNPLTRHESRQQGMDPWWARAAPPAAGPQSSFIEPPTFGDRHETDHHWSHYNHQSDVRESRVAGLQSSFLEPPSFARQHVWAGNSTQFDKTRSVEVQDQREDLNGFEWKNETRNSMSRTTYLEESNNEESGLPAASALEGSGRQMADIYSRRSSSLPVRIIPRSSDPV